jgi:hypothetical protein
MTETRSNDVPADGTPHKKRRTRSPRLKSSTPLPAVAQEIIDSRGLGDEIYMMRMVIRKACDLADAGRSVSELLNIFDSLGKSCTRLATLLKAERTLNKEQDASLAISQALKEISDELGIN